MKKLLNKGDYFFYQDETGKVIKYEVIKFEENNQKTNFTIQNISDKVIEIVSQNWFNKRKIYP